VLSIVAHEHRNEESKNEDSGEEIEDNEEHGVTLRGEILWLRPSTSNGHCVEHHINPAFLGDNLEKNE